VPWPRHSPGGARLSVALAVRDIISVILYGGARSFGIMFLQSRNCRNHVSLKSEVSLVRCFLDKKVMFGGLAHVVTSKVICTEVCEVKCPQILEHYLNGSDWPQRQQPGGLHSEHCGGSPSGWSAQKEANVRFVRFAVALQPLTRLYFTVAYIYQSFSGTALSRELAGVEDSHAAHNKYPNRVVCKI
jgi:hypothetical protein